MGLMSEVANGLAVVGGVVLMVGGVAISFYAIVKPLRRKRKINKARTVHSRTQLTEVLANRKRFANYYLPIQCKLEGKVVVLPGAKAHRSIATGEKVAIASVRETRVTSNTYVDRVTGNVKENRKESVTEDLRENPWVVEIDNDIQVHVDIKGAELDLKIVSNTHYLQEGILPDGGNVFLYGFLNEETNGTLVMKKKTMFWSLVSARTEEEWHRMYSRHFFVSLLSGLTLMGLGAYIVTENIRTLQEEFYIERFIDK